MDVEDALELLSSQFTNRAVRQYAVSRLKEANDDVRGYVLISTHEVSFLCVCIYHGTWLAWLQDCMLTKNVNVVKCISMKLLLCNWIIDRLYNTNL